MDYTRKSILALFRGPLLYTPQGWVVLTTALISWLLFADARLHSEPLVIHQLSDRGAALLGIWPVLVFLFYVHLCMPHFRRSWRQTMLLLLSALSLPVVELLKGF
ncbi:MAG: hypothetical protein O9341_03080 [Paucibacter sp.]|nr:hypothetical protein [Roseateles sp.]